MNMWRNNPMWNFYVQLKEYFFSFFLFFFKINYASVEDDTAWDNRLMQAGAENFILKDQINPSLGVKICTEFHCLMFHCETQA